MSESNGWRTNELQDLVEIDPEVLRENTDRDFHFHYVDIASVSEGRIDVPSTTIAFRDSPSRARKVVRRGDVLMSTVRPNLKAFAYFDHPFDDCVASTGFAVLRAKGGVDSRFVLYSILSESVTRQIEAHVVGSNYPAINSTAVSQLKVFTPTPVEQSKIAEILSTVDRAIEQTESLIAKQQRIKTGLMQDLLTRGIDEQGNLRSEETHQFKDSPLGRIPVEWDVEELQRRAMVKGGKRLPAGHPYAEGDTGCRYLRTMDFINKRLDYASMNFLFPKTFRVLERYEINDGDVFISIAGVNLGTAGVFRPTIADRTILTENAVKIRFLSDDIPEYLAIQINGPLIQKQILEDKGIGAGVPKLALYRVQQFDVPWPTKDEQSVIVERLRQFEESVTQREETLAKLRALKTALMQDLLTGEIRVTPLLEPAVTT